MSSSFLLYWLLLFCAKIFHQCWEVTARRGSQGASRAAPGKSGLHARGEGERLLALESREWGRKESDTTERLPFHFSLSCVGEGNGNPLQCESQEALPLTTRMET